MCVYHFTSMDSFKKILESGELLLCDLDYSNDPSEGIYQREIIDDIVKKEYPESWQFIFLWFHMNTAKSTSFDCDESKLRLLSISFSKELKHIHNWMEYGDYGKGVAIEIDWNKFCCELRKEFPDSEDFLKTGEVIYSIDTVKDLIKKIKNVPAKDCAEISRRLLALYPFIKHPSYSIEKEYRIAIVGSLLDISRSHACQCDIENHNLFNDNKSFHTYSLNFEEMIKRNIVTHIYLGSNTTFSDSVRISQFLVQKYNLNITFFDDTPIGEKRRRHLCVDVKQI